MADGKGSTMPADRANEAAADLPQFGERYRVDKELGRGGMGRVFAARDLKLSRDVAIKVLVGGTDDENVLLRFEQEARAAASLDHPNIIAVYDIGHSQGGPFIVSELLRGKTLRDRMGIGPLPWEQALDYARQMAQGLAAAHSHGVIHRDLKPENVFVTERGQLKLLDFGIAKVIGAKVEGPAASPHSTQAGAILGTVAYMSPEQVRGKPADQRSDVFSFGVVLHELLSGRTGFARATPVETACAILGDEAPAVPARVPPDLAQIVRRCLEKDPDRRFQSAEDLAGALSGVAAARPTRRRMLVAVVAGAGAALLALAILRPGTGDSQSFRRLAVLPLANLSRDPEQEYFADGMTDTLIAELAQLGGLQIISRTSSMRYKAGSKALPDVARELGVDAVVEGSVERAGSAVRITVQLVDARTDTHLWARSYTRDLRDVLAMQDEVARAIAGEIRLRLTPQERARLERSRPVDPAAYEAYLKGLYHWNFHNGAEMKRAVAEYQRAIGLDPRYALAWVGLSDAYHILPFNADVDPTDFLPRAKESALKAIALEPQLSEAHASLAFVLALHDWDWTGAEREYRQAIDLSPSNSSARAYQAMTLSIQGRHAEAIPEATRAKELDPASPVVGLHLARVHFFARHHDQATQVLLRSIEFNPGFWPLHLFLGHVHEQQGRYADALAELRKAEGPTLAATASIGHLYALSGNRAGAEKILWDLIARSQAGYLPPSYVARILVGLGQHDQAFAWLERAYAVRDGHLPLVAVEPAFDPLRADPRMNDLLRRMNLAR